jgi:hypothetical protein
VSVIWHASEITVPAGTAKSAPQTTDVGFAPSTVDSITVRVPPGPLGQVGWRILSGAGQIWPWTLDSWVVADDETIEIVPTGWPTAGAWSIEAYNTGDYDHTLYVRFATSPVAPAPAPPVTLPAADLSVLPPPPTLDMTGLAAP